LNDSIGNKPAIIENVIETQVDEEDDEDEVAPIVVEDTPKKEKDTIESEASTHMPLQETIRETEDEPLPSPADTDALNDSIGNKPAIIENVIETQVDEEDDEDEVAPIVVEDEEGSYRMLFPFRISEVGTEEFGIRKRDLPMFTPAVRADIYKVLRSPSDPDDGAPAPSTSEITSAASTQANLFSALLLGKNRKTNYLSEEEDATWGTYAFCDRSLYFEMKEIGHPQLEQYSALDDKEMLEAIAIMGKLTPKALAITKAFEAYLSQTAWTWGDREACGFAVEFLIAFGNELSSRLDINHRIRSTKLTDEEIEILSKEPFCNHVDREAMQCFQDKWKS
jgi:hypothetical protein